MRGCPLMANRSPMGWRRHFRRTSARASINDADYLLAVAPDQFMSAAGSYRITVDASLPQLAPANLAANASVTDLWTLGQSTRRSRKRMRIAILPESIGDSIGFRVPLESASPADVTISVDTSMFAPVISVYDASSRQLTHAASRRDAGRGYAGTRRRDGRGGVPGRRGCISTS